MIIENMMVLWLLVFLVQNTVVATNQTTTTQSLCEDVLTTCDEMDQTVFCVGDYYEWAYDHCRLTCRMCTDTTYPEFKLQPLYGNENEGYVEAKIRGTWGILTSYYGHYDDTTARNLCDYFGFGSVGFSTSSYVDLNFTNSVVSWNRLVKCSGNETNISECLSDQSTYYGDVVNKLNKGWTMLHCYAFEVTDVRLAGGLYPHGGRFEVKVGSRWGITCLYPNFGYRYSLGTGSGGSSLQDVACSMIGYTFDRSAWINYPIEFSNNSVPITNVWMTSLDCDSGVTNINQCSFMKGTDYPFCTGRPLKCQPVQLVNGTTSNSGIIAAGLFGQQHVICGTSEFNAGAASVTCSLLGYQYFHRVSTVQDTSNYTAVFNGSILCEGSEKSLEICEIIQQGECQDSSVLLIECSDCLPGYFGSVCTECSCNNRSSTTCNSVTGECSCIAGWTGTSCDLDVDECTVPTSCPDNSACRNTPGSYQCDCNTGYSKSDDNWVCSDVDECMAPNTCPDNSICINTPGSYRCDCSPDYTKTDGDCNAIVQEECPPGSYLTVCTECSCNNRSKNPCDIDTGECSCIEGWTGTNCQHDINECTIPNMCPDNSVCANEQGSYQCECITGYTEIEGDCLSSKEADSSLLIIILSSAIGGLLLICVVAICCMCMNRMKASTDGLKGNGTKKDIGRGMPNPYSPSTIKSDDYSTIDVPSWPAGQVPTLSGSRNYPYATIDDTAKPLYHKLRSNDARPELPRRISENESKSMSKDALPIPVIKDYDYPYPAVIPKDDDGYLKLSDHPNNILASGQIRTGNSGSKALPMDEDGYLRAVSNDNIPTEYKNRNYQKLNVHNKQEHEYDKMKRY